jgi:hypothetical protein
VGKTRTMGGKGMKCRHCQGELTTQDKPYLSKQAGMEGEYHWACFIEACRDRVPTSLGAFDVPIPHGESEEADVESAPANLDE